jgi:hypothetical protein
MQADGLATHARAVDRKRYDEERINMKRALIVIAGMMGVIATLTTMLSEKPPQVVKLSMVIENSLTDGVTATTISGDGLGEYVNGAEGVSVQFGSGGTLFANLWPQPDFGQRNVSFDHSFPAPYASPETTHPELVRIPPSGVLSNPHFGSLLVTNSIPIQNMAVGASQCLTFWWAFSGTSPTDELSYTWRDNFHSNNANTPDSLASFAVVTRNSTATWTVESNKNQAACPNLNQPSQDSISMVLHGTTLPGKRGSSSAYTVKDGYYIMPFRLTLTALP